MKNIKKIHQWDGYISVGDLNVFKKNLKNIVQKLPTLGDSDKWHMNYPPRNYQSKFSKIITGDIKKERQKIFDSKRDFSLYIHVPFCISNCDYCSYKGFDIKQFGSTHEYVKCLINELEYSIDKKKKQKLLSIYMGGGTPTTLTPSDFTYLFKHIKSYFTVSSNIPICVEATPYSITDELAETFSKIGVNKIFLGVQSFNERNLKYVNRPQKNSDVYFAVRTLRKYGIQFISFDIIFGLYPNESEDDFLKDTLPHLEILKPEGISVYTLQNYVKHPERILKSFSLKSQIPIIKGSEYWQNKWIKLNNILSLGPGGACYIWENSQMIKLRTNVSLKKYKDFYLYGEKDVFLYKRFDINKEDSLKQIIIRHLNRELNLNAIYNNFSKDLFWEIISPLKDYVYVENDRMYLKESYTKLLPIKTKNENVNYFILTFIYLYSQEAKTLILNEL